MVSSIWYTIRYMGSVIGVAVFETVLSGATGLNTDSIDGALRAGFSIEALTAGFQYAFLIGVVLSLLIALFSLRAKDSSP